MCTCLNNALLHFTNTRRQYLIQHKELNATKEELEELQMQQSDTKPPTADRSSTARPNVEWEQERNQFIEREKEYVDHIKELQSDLDDLQDIELEYQKLSEEKTSLVKKCKDIFEEHQSTLQGAYM